MESSVIIGIIIAIALMALIIYVILMQPDVSTKTDPILPVAPSKPAEIALTTSTDAVMKSLKAGLKPIPNTKITITYCLFPGDTKIQPLVLQELNRYKLLLDIELIMVPDTAHYIKLKSTVHNILFELLDGILDVAYGTILCVLSSYLPDPLSFIPFPNNPMMLLQFMLSDDVIKSDFGTGLVLEWHKDSIRNKYKSEFLCLMVARQSPLIKYITGREYTPNALFVYYREVGAPAIQVLISIPKEHLVTENGFEAYAKTNNEFGNFKYIVEKSGKYQLPQQSQMIQPTQTT